MQERKKKLAILGTVGVPARYGGFETLTEYLIDSLKEDYDITVYCSSKAYGKDRLAEYKGARLKYLPLNANGMQSIFYDMLAILSTFRSADAILLLGVSGSVIFPLINAFTTAKVLTNIDGLEWRRDKWNTFAKKFLKLSEKIAVAYSDGVVADNKYIQDYVQEEYGKQSFLIAYGADHVQTVKSSGMLEQYSCREGGYAFTVCRIEPENNIELLLTAYSKSTLANPYIFVGNWNNSDYGRKLRIQFKDNSRLILLDPIYDQQLLNELRSNCRIYLHGHSAGGTNPSLVEAMYLGLPVLAFDVPYNRETTFGNALYFSDAEGLTQMLDKLPEADLNAIAGILKASADVHYTWRGIGCKYKDALQSLLSDMR